jgi:glycosyltransferase involved in cell wall biosynthesis
MTAVEAGIPVVATKVRSLDGYLVPGETAVVVPAADAEAMRAAIEALLADPERRRRIRDAALARARGWTYADYFARIATLVLGKREIHPAGPGSG